MPSMVILGFARPDLQMMTMVLKMKTPRESTFFRSGKKASPHQGDGKYKTMKTVINAGHVVMCQAGNSVTARSAVKRMTLSEDLSDFLNRHKEDLTAKEQYFGQMAVNMLNGDNPLTTLVEKFIAEEAEKYGRGR